MQTSVSTWTSGAAGEGAVVEAAGDSARTPDIRRNGMQKAASVAARKEDFFIEKKDALLLPIPPRAVESGKRLVEM
jgi:hypothetical protein